MLPFYLVQQLTYRLLTFESRAHRRGWADLPVVLIVVNRHDAGPSDSPLQTITLPMLSRLGDIQDAPLPDLLHGLAAVLRSSAGIDRRTRGTAGRVLLCGVLYHDLHSSLDTLCRSRRLEALDVDGRSYEIVRREDRLYPTVGHDAGGDGTAIAASHTALTEILAAATRILPARSTS